MRRWAWFPLVSLLVGCGIPDAQATQTRTAEIVELTVSARMLPTANPIAVAPTPAPIAVPVTPATATPNGIATLTAFPQVRPPSPTLVMTFNPDPPQMFLISGSWVAENWDVRVRFFAPPSLVPLPEYSTKGRFALGSPSNIYDFEALDIWRLVGATGGQFEQTWAREVDNERKSQGRRDFWITSAARPQQVGPYVGYIGQFNYLQASNDLRISGTMWVGQVGKDVVIVTYRCTPDRERNLDEELEQVFRTIDFNPR